MLIYPVLLRTSHCSNIDEDVSSLSSFSAELLVETVSKCLLLIKPNLELPTKLPPGMAQRYGVTTTLAEACAVSIIIGNVFFYC